MVALFNGFGGLATFFIAWSEFNSIPSNNFQYLLVMITTYIGGVTFSGSVIAYGKLSETLKVEKVLDNYKIVHNFILHFNYIFVVLNFYNKDFQSRL